jgi:hypothetical protein
VIVVMEIAMFGGTGCEFLLRVQEDGMITETTRNLPTKRRADVMQNTVKQLIK